MVVGMYTKSTDSNVPTEQPSRESDVPVGTSSIGVVTRITSTLIQLAAWLALVFKGVA